MIIAHRDLNAFERSLEQGCALHGRRLRGVDQRIQSLSAECLRTQI